MVITQWVDLEIHISPKSLSFPQMKTRQTVYISSKLYYKERQWLYVLKFQLYYLFVTCVMCKIFNNIWDIPIIKIVEKILECAKIQNNIFIINYIMTLQL